MAGMSPKIRERSYALNIVGIITVAIEKGTVIGSATLIFLALLVHLYWLPAMTRKSVGSDLGWLRRCRQIWKLRDSNQYKPLLALTMNSQSSPKCLKEIPAGSFSIQHAISNSGDPSLSDSHNVKFIGFLF
jgi:hypothetical protein